MSFVNDMPDKETAIMQAQEMHWGIFCSACGACENIGVCRFMCPDGGNTDDVD